MLPTSHYQDGGKCNKLDSLYWKLEDVPRLRRSTGHFFENWDSHSNYLWQKLQSCGSNIPYLPTYESEMTFNYNLLLSHSEFSHLSANKCYHTLAVYSINCWRERVCEYANSSLEREGPYWGLVGSLWVLVPIWPGQISLLYPGDDISKNHLSRPFSFRGDRCLSFPVFFCLVFY